MTFSQSCFVTGTDTGVGKTHVVSRMIVAMRKDGIDAVGMKPICCGGRDDAVGGHLLTGVEDVVFNRLTSHDVVRHKLVGRIVAAYDQYDAGRPDGVRP